MFGYAVYKKNAAMHLSCLLRSQLTTAKLKAALCAPSMNIWGGDVSMISY